MTTTPWRYRSSDEDSGRWEGFPFRDGDIVISTRSKSGTTWMQMICALLIFQTPELEQPLHQLSPWLDHLVTPREEVFAELAAQTHRRFIKTHTPLDGVPIDPRATYIVVARPPLDMAVSLYHQADNLDRAKLRALTGEPEPASAARPRPALRDWLLRWIRSEDDPRERPDSLSGVLWHLSDAWARRRDPNVLLVHFNDLSSDLEGQMRRIAVELGITIDEDVWPSLVRSASFLRMKEKAAELAPNRGGILKDTRAFFRRGNPGAGAEVLTPQELEEYGQRINALGSADLLTWLHR